MSIFLFDIQDPKFAVQVKIDAYKSRYISILLFDINTQEPKSAEEVKIDSYKSRHISSIYIFDLNWTSIKIDTSVALATESSGYVWSRTPIVLTHKARL